jgi:hypothetical protein
VYPEGYITLPTYAVVKVVLRLIDSARWVFTCLGGEVGGGGGGGGGRGGGGGGRGGGGDWRVLRHFTLTPNIAMLEDAHDIYLPNHPPAPPAQAAPPLCWQRPMILRRVSPPPHPASCGDAMADKQVW